MKLFICNKPYFAIIQASNKKIARQIYTEEVASMPNIKDIREVKHEEVVDMYPQIEDIDANYCGVILIDSDLV